MADNAVVCPMCAQTFSHDPKAGVPHSGPTEYEKHLIDEHQIDTTY